MRKALGIAAILFFALPLGAAAATLTQGSSGSEVLAMQKLLAAQGYLKATATGYFGQQTLAALEQFQCDKKISCTGSSDWGVYGPKTQGLLQAGTAANTGGALTGKSLGSSYTGPLEFSGWLPYWRASSSTLDVAPHLSQLKTVMPFTYTMTADGHVNDAGHMSQDPWPAFIAAAKAQGARVVPTIMWGNGDAIQATLSDSQKRVALEDEIVQLVKSNNFDGVDIDFEAKKRETVNYFSTFLKGLYQRMGKKWVYCTIEARMPLVDRYSSGATIPSDATDYANDYTQINKYCDRVEIMAYDQGTIDVRLNDARQAPYAPVADPGWVEDVVTLAAQSIAKNKIIIGVPTYGYEYQVTPLVQGGYQYKVLWPFNYRYATQIASQLGITPARNSAGELGFVYNDTALAAGPTFSNQTETQTQDLPTSSVANNNGSQVVGLMPFNYVSWSDAQAVADKVALARKLGVRGVAVFKLDGGEDQGIWNVLK